MPNRSRINATRINALAARAPFEQPVAINIGMPFAQAVRRALVPIIGWALGTDNSRPTQWPHRSAEPVQRPAVLPWSRLLPRDLPRGNGWQQGHPIRRLWYGAWGLLRPREFSRVQPWAQTGPIESLARTPWRNPPIVDVVNRIPWGRLAVREAVYDLGWHGVDMLHPDYHIPWGQGRPPPTIWPNPEIDNPLPPEPPEPPVYVPPPGDQVGLAFRCPAYKGPGDQVAIPFRRFQCMRSGIMIHNTITCTNITTGQGCEVMDLEIRGDIESFTDGLTAQIPYHAAEILDDGPVEMEFGVNGLTFLMLVEAVTRDSAWDSNRGRSGTITVRGRSVSAELDEPYSAPRSRLETETRTALQLMQQELPVDGSWTISAHPAWTNWTVPGGTWSYTDLTPLRAITRIAAASGAVIQQVPGARELRIVPRYPVDPWKQADTEAELEIDYGLVQAQTVEFEAAALANGVYVAGETADGVLVRAIRQGTAGAPWLDIVTDPLITDAQAGLQRARAELGATGRRDLVQLTIPVATGEDDPGLVRPGRLALVLEDVETWWKAQTVGYGISAQWSEENGLVIWQAVTLERYRDD